MSRAGSRSRPTRRGARAVAARSHDRARSRWPSRLSARLNGSRLLEPTVAHVVVDHCHFAVERAPAVLMHAHAEQIRCEYSIDAANRTIAISGSACTIRSTRTPRRAARRMSCSRWKPGRNTRWRSPRVAVRDATQRGTASRCHACGARCPRHQRRRRRARLPAEGGVAAIVAPMQDVPPWLRRLQKLAADSANLPHQRTGDLDR